MLNILTMMYNYKIINATQLEWHVTNKRITKAQYKAITGIDLDAKE